MEEARKKEKIKACIAIAVIILAILITGIVSIKYSVEGETDMPFTLSKIVVVSRVEGVQNEGAEEKWNLSVFQNNDIYLSIEKRENYKEELLKNISIENIKVIESPQKGEIRTYMPNSADGNLFSYKNEYIVENNKLTFKGASKSNNKTLEIGNQGGTIAIRIANANIARYISNEDTEIVHDTLLSKLDVKTEEITFKVSFDVVINVKNTSYITNVVLDLPCSEDLVQNGIRSKEITDKFVFKRVVK